MDVELDTAAIVTSLGGDGTLDLGAAREEGGAGQDSLVHIADRVVIGDRSLAGADHGGRGEHHESSLAVHLEGWVLSGEPTMKIVESEWTVKPKRKMAQQTTGG